MQQNDFGSSNAHRPSRRAILGALAATTALAGCTSKHDGYGAPMPDSAAGRSNRAFFVLWLLLTTDPDYFAYTPIDLTTNQTVITPNGDLKTDKLFKDLKYFYDGTLADQEKAMGDILNYLGTNSFDGYAMNADGKVIKATINYGMALKVVMQAFQNLGGSSSSKLIPLLANNGGGFYTGPSGSCPADIKELLSIATDNPVTTNPS
jgi:hypothetical protein